MLTQALPSPGCDRSPSTFWARARPSLVFLTRFTLLSVCFYALCLQDRFDRYVLASHLKTSAIWAGTVLSWIGETVSVRGTTLQIGGVALTLRRGCDAVEPVALLTAAIMAFPHSWARRFSGIFLGTILLLGMNVIRLVSLCWVRRHCPECFQPLHIEVWPVLFVLVTLGYWLAWVRPSPRASLPHVSP